MAKLTMVDGSIFEGDMVEFAEMTRIMQGDEAPEEMPETETKDSLLFEGGYAKVVGETVCGEIEVGSHVKLVSEVDSDGDFQLLSIVEGLDDYAKPEELVGIAKDEALGEQVGSEGPHNVEFSEGDIVYYEDYKWFGNNGFGEVIGSPLNHGVIVQATGKHGIESNYYLSFDLVTLVCKADNREDKH